MAGGLCNSDRNRGGDHGAYDDLVCGRGCVRVFCCGTGIFRAVAACGVPDRIVCPSSLYKTARYPVRQPGDREDECGRADRKKGKSDQKNRQQ